MALLRPAPWGAVCFLYALSLGGMSPPALCASPSSATADTDTSAPWRDPIRALWMANPDVRAARADLEAAREVEDQHQPVR